VMPPNEIYYKPNKGILMVRATAEELDIIQQAIEVLNEPPPMITLELRLLEISQPGASESESRPSRDSVDQHIPTGILTERQLDAMLRQLEDRPGVRVVSGPRLTTLSGRETRCWTVRPSLWAVCSPRTFTPSKKRRPP
jgi:type II secretory pathway component GspD/PulD (secretin)